jgi:hypothetical protein
MANTKIPPELVDDQVFGRRNRIINGDMRIAQRGTSFTGSEYTLDRFEQLLSGGSATTTQESFALGSEVEGFTKYLKQAVSTGNDYCGIIYRVEDVRSLPQGNVTISFYAKGTNPAGGSLQLVVYPMHDGSTVHSTLLDTTITLTSSWQRFTKTFTVPSFSGMTTPTANSQFYIRLSQSGSDSGTAAWELNLTGVQLEVGSQATPFEHRSIGEELALCQRYCQKYGPYGTNSFPFGPSGYSYGATTTAVGQILPAELRASPTISFHGDGNPELRGGNTAGSNTLSAVTSVSVVSAGTSLLMNVTTSGTSNETGQVRVLCNAYANTFMIYDAEL